MKFNSEKLRLRKCILHCKFFLIIVLQMTTGDHSVFVTVKTTQCKTSFLKSHYRTFNLLSSRCPVFAFYPSPPGRAR